MKLLFYSKYSGQNGTTSNLSVIATYLAYRYPLKIFVLQSQYKKNGLDNAMLGSSLEEGDTSSNGIDMLIRMIKSEPVNKDMIDSCSVDLYHEKLHILPCSSQQNESMFDAMVGPALIYCMNAICQYYDVTMVDVGTVDDSIDDSLLKQADILVINMSQNPIVIEDTLHMKVENKKKVFYLIGNYDPVSKYNLSYISSKYKIPLHQIGVVPYNPMFRDAYAEGTIVKYISLIEKSTKDELNHYFVSSLEETVRKLAHFCKIPIEQKDNKSREVEMRCDR